MQKFIKLRAYTDSEILREYPDLTNNHRPKINPDQETKKPSKQRVSRFSSLHRARCIQGLAFSASGKSEGFRLYTEVSLCACAKGARI